MPEISLLSETELRGLLALDRDIRACVANAFEALATKPVEMPPILHLAIAEANGEIDVKTTSVPGLDVLEMNLTPGCFDNTYLAPHNPNVLMEEIVTHPSEES